MVIPTCLQQIHFLSIIIKYGERIVDYSDLLSVINPLMPCHVICLAGCQKKFFALRTFFSPKSAVICLGLYVVSIRQSLNTFWGAQSGCNRKCFNLRYFTFKILVYLDYLLKSTSILGKQGVPTIFLHAICIHKAKKKVKVKNKQKNHFAIQLLTHIACKNVLAPPMSPKYLYF